MRTEGDGLPGRVRTAFFMGMTHEYLIETPVGEVRAVEPLAWRSLLAVGAEVRLQFLQAGVYLLPPS